MKTIIFLILCFILLSSVNRFSYSKNRDYLDRYYPKGNVCSGVGFYGSYISDDLKEIDKNVY